MVFPNTYSIGITNLGYQVIWATLAQRDDVDVRRLFTDQTEKAHHESELFGISLSWELDGPNFLDLLDKENIPIWSNKRLENHPIIFGGGQVLTANPEPFAPFLDVVLLGDGEELLPKFIDCIQSTRSLSKKEKLIECAQIPGVYVPNFYRPTYKLNGDIKQITPITSKVPNILTKETWKGKTLSHSTVITPEAAWPSIHMVEVVRSCPELCRFCLASYLNLPFRSASLDDGLIPAVEKGLKKTNRIGLLGASITQHPQFEELLQWLNNTQFDDIRLSLSSVRAGTVTPGMTRILSKRNSKSLTIAIESGSERMRKVINKKLNKEEILAAASYAKEGGLKGLKLYGMVGLPTENEDDVKATAELLLMIKRKVSGLRLTLGVSTFVPKAHTPFQWYGVRKESEKRLKLLSKMLHPNGIQIRSESYRWSLIQALIARSDRRLAPVIASLRGKANSFGEWKKAYKAIEKANNNAPTMPSWETVIHNNWNLTKELPWQHLQGALKKNQLIEHQKEVEIKK